jgi:hypothetical protein
VGVDLSIEFHGSHPSPQTGLDLDVQFNCGLLEDGDAAEIVGHLHELAEGEVLVFLEF